jgi:hypothetical protein
LSGDYDYYDDDDDVEDEDEDGRTAFCSRLSLLSLRDRFGLSVDFCSLRSVVFSNPTTTKYEWNRGKGDGKGLVVVVVVVVLGL